jgi:arylsulfatase A
MIQIRIPIALTLFAALLNLDAAAESKKATRPNIVIMMVDDMGFAGPSIAPYGNPHYKTPGMDRLAREGMLFTDFHSSGTVCSPTRAGLLTGRYQQRVGVEAVIHPHSNHPEHRKGLHKSEVTFAELFKEAGYVTGVVGKWHLGYAGENPEYHPQNHGFDYFKGYHSGNIDYINHWGDHMKHDWWHGRKETKEKGYTTHLINKYALEFIEQNKDKPFCLYVAHESPHAPVQGPNDPIQRGPGAKKRATPHAEAMKQMILEMDKGVAQVRSKLVELGLEKNTLFLFFSDNGDSPGTATGHPAHRGHKGSVYEGGTRVPAIAWWPGKIKPGTRTDALGISLDVMPTILSAAGIEKPKNRALDGIDLSPVIFEQKALPPRPLYWGSLSNNGARSEALRDGPWKLVVQHPRAKPGTFANERVELFRLDKDISEKTNLAAEEPKRAAAMLKQLKAWYAETQETATYQPGGWIRKPHGELPELLAASIYKSPNVDITVPNGPYTLQLLLYEGWRSRSADIVIEGKTVRKAYDMFKEQGGNFDHGSVLRHTFTLTDGNIDIEIKGPLHLGGLILSRGKADSEDRVAIVKSQADLDLKDVIKAINFGDTKDLNIGDVKFTAAAVNTTVDGVTNTAGGDVHSGEFGQQLPQIQKEKAPNRANAKGKPNLDTEPRKNTEFFNGKDLTGWSASEMKYWSVKDGAIVGHSAVNVPKNEFIWADGKVQDFYLTVDVKLTPDNRNAGIQFRSKKANASGQAIGYQADVGAGVWGKLYHEHGRGKLDWNNNAVGVVKPGDWNRYEILAVGHKIWTAINGKLCVALEDPQGELSGKISFQIHGGPAQTVFYRNPTLAHNPKIALEKQTEKQLLAALPKKKAEAPKPAPPKPISTPLPHWTRLIMAVDPGSQGEAWAKPAFDHGKWKTMKVPGHFENAGLPGHDGVVWFRKTIELSAGQAKSKAILNLGQIDDMDVTWVNGRRVGGYENPGHHYTVRNYPVPAGLLKTGKNTIAVRVMDHGYSGGIAGKPEQLFLKLGKETVSLANLWHFAPGANLNALNKHAARVASVQALLRPLLVSAHPGQQLHVRNMAWAADTVYTQQRPRNFFAANKPGYGEKDRRPAMAADVLFVWFGQMESLEGLVRLDDFTKAYIEMLTQFAGYTGRLVLVTPVPGEDPLDLGLKVKDRNAALAKYALAIRQIARDRNLPLVDLFTALRGKSVTADGLFLSEKGHQLAAQAFARQLGVSPNLSANTEPLRQAIRKKNALWKQYWFPSNWAFLYGNRQQTASSRSHTNGSYRWFPEEIQAILPELEKLQNAITKEAARVGQ